MSATPIQFAMAIVTWTHTTHRRLCLRLQMHIDDGVTEHLSGSLDHRPPGAPPPQASSYHWGWEDGEQRVWDCVGSCCL